MQDYIHTSFECPFCEEYFNINEIPVVESEGEEVIFCPICEEAVPFEDVIDFYESDDVQAVEDALIEEATKNMNRRAALQEAVDQYWGEGKTVDQIKQFLVTQCKVSPVDLPATMEDLGNTIAKFDSDMSPADVKALLYG